MLCTRYEIDLDIESLIYLAMISAPFLNKWNEIAQVIGKLPFIPGHEATGVITEVGKDVTDLTVGTRIAIENHFYCGDCYSCEVRIVFRKLRV